MQRIDEGLLESIGSIEIPQKKYEEAESRYQRIGEWLNREESTLSEYSPKIYPQGSFLLGTAIKPIKKEADYDVDAVCELDISTSDISQKELKKLIGLEIKAYCEENNFNKAPVDGKRCWTIEYADGSQFHLDVLPAIPSAESERKMLKESGYYVHAASELTDTAIYITDRLHPDFDKTPGRWPRSNPKGYAEWFNEQQKQVLQERKMSIAAQVQASVEEIPNSRVNTPLQQAVKYLKRHRDVLYGDDDDKPISIIITTLAAKSYSGEDNVAAALVKIVAGMRDEIEKTEAGFCVRNPVYPPENFADKWPESPRKERIFFDWLSQAESNVSEILRYSQDETKDFRGLITATLISEENSLNPTSLSAIMKATNGLPVNVVTPAHRQEPAYPFEIDMAARVHIGCNYGLSRSNMKNSLDNFGEISKRNKLEFVATLDADWEPDKIQWQVVNTGTEAKDDSCLRGGFYNSSKKRNESYIRDEETLYPGDHCVECIFIKGGVIKARSGDFVIRVT